MHTPAIRTGRGAAAGGAAPGIGGGQGRWSALSTAALAAGTAAAVILVWAAVRQGATDPSAVPAAPEPTALFAACRAGDRTAVGRLLAAGAAPDATSPDGTTPLMVAAFGGHAHLIGALVGAGADPNAVDSQGLSALSHAVAAARVSCVSRLLEAGAEADVEASPGEWALCTATRRGDARLAAVIAGHCQNRSHLSLALHQSVVRGRPEITRLLAGAGASPVAFGGGHPNTLDLLVAAGDRATLATLLENHGSDAFFGTSPDLLATAIDQRSPELVSLLVTQGLDPDLPPLPGNSRRSSVSRAVSGGQGPMATLLLHHCADPDGALALAFATGERHLIEAVLDGGVDVNAPHPGQPHPLAAALARDDIRLARRLLDLGADPDVILPAEGQPALAVAAASGDTELARLLLDYGAEPDIALSHPASEAFLCHLGSGTESLRYLLARDRGFTPLMVAAGSAHHGVIKLLLAHGAQRGNTTRSYRRYPVAFAAANGDIYAQQLLLGRDPEEEPTDEHREIIVSLSRQHATLYQGGNAVLSSKVSTGKEGYQTKTGKFVISNKHRKHTSSIYDANMPYFQRLSCGDFGFHEGYVPGYPASHGCIRMPGREAAAFFETTRVGDVVTILD